MGTLKPHIVGVEVRPVLTGAVGLVIAIVWVGMIQDCLRHERDRQKWLLILGFVPIVGGLVYGVMRWIPRLVFCSTHRGALQIAQTNATRQGTAQSFVALGQLLHEMGDRVRAAAAFAQAIAHDPENPQALWGAASLAIEQHKFDIARNHLETLTTLQPNFSNGDASLTYGRVLFHLGDMEAACAHLTEHLRQWTQPEVYLLLAKIQQQQGDPKAARTALETMILTFKNSASFHQRHHRSTLRRGERMLRAMAR